jgi:hypothetical protein
VNKKNRLLQCNSYFKSASFVSRPTHIESDRNGIYSLIQHSSQREALMNRLKNFSKKLLLLILTSSLLAGNAIAINVASNEVQYVANCPKPSDGPYAVELGGAGSFAILSQSGITNVYESAIVGDVGTSPITGAALLLRCEEVDGNIYSVDAAGPLPCVQSAASYLTAAVSDMGAAYVNAAGRSTPDFIEFNAGDISGLTLVPGLYKWSTGVIINTDVTFSGGPNDVWILQVAGTMTQASSTRVTLTGGALAKNIFWQVAGVSAIGTYAHFEGIILSKTMIAVKTGATVNGRLLAQTEVTLQMNTITAPSE